MVFAKKCDRCGKLYEMYNIKIGQKTYCGFICPECMRELLNWYYGIEDPKKKEKKEDADNVSL